MLVAFLVLFLVLFLASRSKPDSLSPDDRALIMRVLPSVESITWLSEVEIPPSALACSLYSSALTFKVSFEITILANGRVPK